MKIILLIAIIQLTCFYVSGQTLFDIYLKLPEKEAFGNTKTRQLMIDNYKNGIKSLGRDVRYRFDIVDERNGFISVTGAMEGIWEMCYWNLSDNRKLIAVYSQGCGPVCYIESFKFYLFENGKMIEQEIRKIIPDYDTLYQDFFINYSENMRKELREQDIIATLLFKLPRTGKDIIAKFGNEDSQDTYKKFSRGDRMVLKWDNGKFKKGSIFWSE